MAIKPRYGKLPLPPAAVGRPAPPIMMPPPGPLWTPPGRPVSGGQPTATRQEFSSSVALINGQPQVLCNLFYDKPTPITVFCVAPILNQTSDTYDHGEILGGGGTVDLKILGEALVGVGGTSFKFNFDIPIEQMVQFSCVCESLKLTARVYAELVTIVLAGGPPTIWGYPGPHGGTDQVISPPTFGGQIDPGFAPVFVQALGGRGISGLSNLTRRFVIQDLDASGGVASILSIPVPSMSTFVQFIGKPGPLLSFTGAAGGITIGGLALPTVTPGIPIPSITWGNSGKVNFTQNAAAGSWEAVFRLGLSGVLS